MAHLLRRPQPLPQQTVVRDIVAGPTSGLGAIPPVDPAARRNQAWQDGTAAAGVSTHDADSLTHDAPLIYAARVAAEHDQWQNRALQDCSHDQQVARRLLGMKESDVVAAGEDLANCEHETGQINEEVQAHRQVLRDGTEPARQWRAPERLRESAATTWRRTYLLPGILAFADVGINVLALQTLGGGIFELVSFAIVLGVFAVVLGHQAGVHLRCHPRADAAATWSERWLLPLGYAAALALVVSFLATLRLAYIATPTPVDPTGVASQSLLGSAGVPGWVLWAGLAALQFGLGVAVAVHTHHVHNPYVAAHRIAETLRDAQSQATTEARGRVEQAIADVAAAEEDLTVHIPAQWAAQSAALAALARQVLAIYADAYVHAGGNPELTVAMEARLATQPRNTIPALGPAAPDLNTAANEARPDRGARSPVEPATEGDTGQDGRAA
jgi:hypothetical protein